MEKEPEKNSKKIILQFDSAPLDEIRKIVPWNNSNLVNEALSLFRRVATGRRMNDEILITRNKKTGEEVEIKTDSFDLIDILKKEDPEQ